MNLSRNIKIDQVEGYAAAAQNLLTSDILDMSGYEGVMFIAEFGTLIEAGTLDVYVQQNTVNSSVGMARVATTTVHTVTAADAALAQSCVVVDIYQPTERYVCALIKPAVQNAVVLGITAIRYKAKNSPDASSTAIKTTFLQSPAEV